MFRLYKVPKRSSKKNKEKRKKRGGGTFLRKFVPLRGSHFKPFKAMENGAELVKKWVFLAFFSKQKNKKIDDKRVIVV